MRQKGEKFNTAEQTRKEERKVRASRQFDHLLRGCLLGSRFLEPRVEHSLSLGDTV